MLSVWKAVDLTISLSCLSIVYVILWLFSRGALLLACLQDNSSVILRILIFIFLSPGNSQQLQQGQGGIFTSGRGIGGVGFPIGFGFPGRRLLKA
jgi:hypothetical protein